jgi:hypothetical protein
MLSLRSAGAVIERFPFFALSENQFQVNYRSGFTRSVEDITTFERNRDWVEVTRFCLNGRNIENKYAL